MRSKTQNDELRRQRCHDSGDDYRHQLLGEHHVADLLCLSVKTLRNWRVSGNGPEFVRLSRRAIRYRRSTVITWIDSQTVSSTSDAAYSSSKT